MVNTHKIGATGKAAATPLPSLTRMACQGLCLCALVTVTASCAMKRSGYDVPEVALPAQYKNAPVAAPEETPSPGSATKNAEAQPDATPVEWWRHFGNRELEGLIDRGIASNPDVRMATLRMAQAKARADQARAGQLPEVSAPALVANQYPGGSAVGDVPVEGERNKSQKSYQASLRGTWRVDIWGEQSALAESAQLQLWRAAFERDDVQRRLAASLASNYVEYASLNDRLRVARELETVLSSTLATVEKRVAAGDATLTELEQQRAAIYSLRATIPALEQQRDDTINAIAFLVGTVPKSLELSSDGLDALALPAAVPGLPSALLLRRPDVRMAEARMLAADADIDVARARLLPPMDLSAQVGYSSVFLGQLFQPHALFWSTVASVTASIFDGGKRSSDKEFSQAVHEEMVEGYIRAINQAMREVETSLATVRLTARRLEAQEEAANAARRAWEISSKVYLVGGADYLTLLETERTYYRYLDEFQRTRMEHFRGYINLFQALGGGIKPGETLPGKGARPAAAEGGKAESRKAAASVEQKPRTFEGVNLDISSQDEGTSSGEDFWQVELTGIYHRSAIGAAWRDLRARFPKQLEGRMLRPRLSGRIEESMDGQEAWYRLYVAKFPSVASAQEFCAMLLAEQRRCRVISATSDETIPLSPAQKTSQVETKPPAQPVAVAQEAPVQVATIAEEPRATVVEAVPVPVSAAGREPVESVPLPPPAVSQEKPAVEQPLGKQAGMEPRERLAYTVQLGAFSNLENAAISHALWRSRLSDVYVSESKDGEGRTWYAVRTGVFEQKSEGVARAHAIREKEAAGAVVVPTLVDASGKPAAIAPTDLPPAGSKTAAPVVPEPPEAPRSLASAADKPLATKPTGAQERGAYTLQLGAFSAVENAIVAYEFWRGRGHEAYVAEITDYKGRPWFAVRSRVFLRQPEAAAAALAFGRQENAQALVVPTLVGADGKPRFLDPAKLPKSPAPMAIQTKEPVSVSAPVASAAQSSAGKGPAYAVQVGAFSSLEKAAESVARWQGLGHSFHVSEMTDAAGRILYAVRAGVYRSRQEAQALMRRLGGKEAKALLVMLDEAAADKRIDVSHLLKGSR